ncbi:MAG: hypothetical protein ACSLFK_00260 [Gemmatimonadaceae bacterium]
MTDPMELPHIGRIKWSKINWLPESPDQYEDGLPPDKEEVMIVPITGESEAIVVMAHQFSPEILIYTATIVNGVIAMTDSMTGFVCAIPADMARRVFDALLEMHRIATHGDLARMDGIEEIRFKPRRPVRPSRNYLALLKPGADQDGNREGIFFEFERANGTLSMYSGPAEQLDPFGELCAHNAYGDTCAAEAILTVPVGDVPAIAYAILKVHRRTREHDYQGPDAGLPDGSRAL